MEPTLDYQISLSTETNTSLYDWCLQEFDENGRQVGEDQIPWIWTLTFKSVDLRYSLTATAKNEYRADTGSENGEPAFELREAFGGRLALKWSRFSGQIGGVAKLVSSRR